MLTPRLSPLKLDTKAPVNSIANTADYSANLQFGMFDTYVHQVLQRRAAEGYTPAQTTRWLTWLARSMAERKLLAKSSVSAARSVGA